MLLPTSYSYFSRLFSSAAQTFLLCRDQDGISFGLNGKTAEKGVCAARVERAEPRSEIRSLVCHPADVLPLRWERDRGRTRVCVCMCACVYANISTEDNKGIVRRGKKGREALEKCNQILNGDISAPECFHCHSFEWPLSKWWRWSMSKPCLAL